FRIRLAHRQTTASEPGPEFWRRPKAHPAFGCGCAALWGRFSICGGFRIRLARREAASPKLDERSGGDKASIPHSVAAALLCGADFQSAADFESAWRAGRQPVRSWTKDPAGTKRPSQIRC